jgi:hypothetical protein
MTPRDAGETGITPDPLKSPRRLRAVESAEREPAARTPQRAPHNLPSDFSSFVGREGAGRGNAVVGEYSPADAHRDGRSKTRLALAAAGELLEGFEDGVWILDLEPLADPVLVPQTRASTLGVREQPGRGSDCRRLGRPFVAVAEWEARNISESSDPQMRGLS